LLQSISTSLKNIILSKVKREIRIHPARIKGKKTPAPVEKAGDVIPYSKDRALEKLDLKII